MSDTDLNNFSTKVPACVVETCYEHRGITYSKTLTPLRCLEALKNFSVRPGDLFIVTWPKSGTTWMEHLALLVQYDGDVTKLHGNHVMNMVCMIESVTYTANPTMWLEIANQRDSPRMMKLHAPPHLLPAELRTGDVQSKVIYVARNPKDAAVSFFHFCCNVPFMPSYPTWDVFFEEFIAGRLPWGSWFENVLPWWERRNHPNVLFVKYEDMKKDLPKVIRAVADFVGKSLTDDVITRIADASTFDAMRASPWANPDFIMRGKLEEKEHSFMRKGVIGDWKNYFSREQNERFDKLYDSQVSGTGLTFD